MGQGFQAFKAWMEDIAGKHGETAVILGMEPIGHYWFALGKFLQDIVKPVHVNLHHVKKSKELNDNNPNKNDRKDPKTIATLVNEGGFLLLYKPIFMQRLGACRTCASRHRKSLRGSRIG